MNQLEAFLEKHRSALIALIDGGAPAIPGARMTLAFVRHVLDAFDALPEVERERPVLSWERSLWWVLFALEELAEVPPEKQHFSYIAYMREGLREGRDRLEARLPPAHGQFATRPGEWDRPIEDDWGEFGLAAELAPGRGPLAEAIAEARKGEGGLVEIRIPLPRH